MEFRRTEEKKIVNQYLNEYNIEVGALYYTKYMLSTKRCGGQHSNKMNPIYCQTDVGTVEIS